MNYLKALCLLCLTGFMSPALAIEPLVEANWVLANQQNKDVLFLDIQPKQQYHQFHIPGAINAPYSGWRTSKKTPPKGMLPPADYLQKKLSALGVTPEKQVVVVATGQGAGDLAAAARVFWTLKYMGHEAVAVLNGGLIAYHEAKGQLEKGNNPPQAGEFKGKLNKAVLAELTDVKTAVKDKMPLVDTRSDAEYLGIYQAGPEQKAGTIPGAKHLPHEWLTVNGSAELHKPDSLRKLFAIHKITDTGANIHFCQSGNRAALNWFVDYAVFGNKKARLYDGSSYEWGRQKDTPMEVQVKL